MSTPPLHPDPEDTLPDEPKLPEEGIALCLSGGGFRAMLYHLGVLWRLNEFGYLPRLRMISSVSGGSITAGLLAYKWARLSFEKTAVTDDLPYFASNFQREVAEPLREVARRSLDWPSMIKGWLTLSGAGAKVADSHDRWLFHGATLQNLTDDKQPNVPRFVFNAANLQTGSNWRFSRRYMGDYKIGLVPNPTVRLAVAVAASGAFPPFLSPVHLKVDPASYDPKRLGLLHGEANFASHILLTDGGVYDNMGQEAIFKRFDTILASDGGMQTKPDPKPAFQLKRVLDLIDSQVRSRRRIELVTAFKRRKELIQMYGEGSDPVRSLSRKGAYWRMNDNLTRYGVSQALPCPPAATQQLAQVATRLLKMDETTQMRLINFGYASCDVHIRTWVDPSLPAPEHFPYSDAGVG